LHQTGGTAESIINRGTVFEIEYLHFFGGHIWLWIEPLPNQEGSDCRTNYLDSFQLEVLLLA